MNEPIENKNGFKNPIRLALGLLVLPELRSPKLSLRAEPQAQAHPAFLIFQFVFIRILYTAEPTYS